MKIVLLTSDSPWQRALSHKMATIGGANLVGIVVQEMPSTASGVWIRKNLIKQPKQVASKIWQRLRYREALRAIDEEALRRFGINGSRKDWPDVESINVFDINGGDSVEFIRALKPDVICVSGTRIVKQPIFDIAPPLGLLNLHTGISPFYKGGPNCTLWCLANGEPWYIGSTLHVLDPGIDTGQLIITEQTPVDANDTAATLVSKAVETGHHLYVRVLTTLSTGHNFTPIPQDQIGTGRTYMTREWNVWQLNRALRYVNSGQLTQWVHAGRPHLSEVKLVNVLES